MLSFNKLKQSTIKFYTSKYSEFISSSFIVPFIFLSLLYFFELRKLSLEDIDNFYTTYITTIFGSSASIFGISLAALSIFISVIYKPAIPKMQEANLLEIFLFPFFITVLMWGIVLGLSLVVFLRDVSNLINFIVSYRGIYLAITLYIICTSILYTIFLSKHVIKTTLISFKGN
ncbi:hypothetical protein [Rummeliibacillus sp. POC4]|uniref:hypothetical protein n=1 Tax=Rummeliibacillus sp. POC4 TaxID=2305899 RepID=UPI000E674E79|nr:hypothetical protein [Rummeliibacillus sp. POC4]RIJ65497.1 hypothetical protein D1606_07965 [Rummeliibacillus sp. POC4]